MSKINLMRKLKQTISYARLAHNPLDAFNLIVLSIARFRPFNEKNLIARLGKYFYPSLIIKPKITKGLSIELDPKDLTHMVITDEFLFNPVYNLNLITFLPDRVIDCGAHIGMFTILASAYFPSASFLSFEPNPSNANQFRKQITRNKLSVKFIEAAVATKEGYANFQNVGTSFGGHISHGNENGNYKVKAVNLKDYIEDDSKLLLKIDIEGEEENVIPVILPYLPKICAVFIETHNGDASWKSIEGQFRNYGFSTLITRQHDKYTDGFATRS